MLQPQADSAANVQGGSGGRLACPEPIAAAASPQPPAIVPFDRDGKQVERRRSHRMRDERDAAVGLIVDALRIHLGQCVDLSFGGAYVRSRLAMKPGARLSLDFHPRSLPPFRIHAHVIRTTSDGFGCAFEHSRNQALARLSLWLAACDRRERRSGTLGRDG